MTIENEFRPKEDLLVCEWILHLLNFRVLMGLKGPGESPPLRLDGPDMHTLKIGKNEGS